MTVPLPDELRNVSDSNLGEPLELIDEQNHSAYVLVTADEFRRLRLAADDTIADTYRAQIESAMRAGWGDPVMDEYNDYDAHRGLK